MWQVFFLSEINTWRLTNVLHYCKGVRIFNMLHIKWNLRFHFRRFIQIHKITHLIQLLTRILFVWCSEENQLSSQRVTNVQSPWKQNIFCSLEAQQNTFYMKSQIHFFTKYFLLQFLKNAPAKKMLTLVGLRHSSSRRTWMEEIKNGWLLESSHETRIAEMNVAQSAVKLQCFMCACSLRQD